MPGARRVGFAAACLLLLIPAHAAAQPDLWFVAQEGATAPAVQVVDSLNGMVVRRYEAPPGVCLGPGVMTEDRRWYLTSTNFGIARFDVASRQLVDVMPLPGSTCVALAVSRSGRWWYRYSYGIGTPPMQIIDPIVRRVVRERAGGAILGFMLDESRVEAVPTAISGLMDLQAWDGPDAIAPMWTLPSVAYSDVEVTPLGVYLLQVSRPAPDTVLADVVRLDPVTGAEVARGQFSRTSAFSPEVSDIALSRGRVFLVAADSSPILGAQKIIATFDQLTLVPLPSAVSNGGGFGGELLVDGSGGMLLQLMHFTGTHDTPATWHRVDTESLALTDLFSGAPIARGALGAGEPPGAPRVAVQPSPDGRLTLDWQPAGGGAVPGGFEVRGAALGAALECRWHRWPATCGAGPHRRYHREATRLRSWLRIRWDEGRPRTASPSVWRSAAFLWRPRLRVSR